MLFLIASIHAQCHSGCLPEISSQIHPTPGKCSQLVGTAPPPPTTALISLNKYSLGGFYPMNTYTKAKQITFHQPHELHLPNSKSQDFAELADKILAVPTGYELKGLWDWSSCNQLSTKVKRLALEEEDSMWTAEQTPRDKQFCGNNSHWFSFLLIQINPEWHKIITR